MTEEQHQQPVTHETLGEEELVALRKERDEYLDALQRLKADFDNFRKRTAREQESMAVRASEALVKELLPVLDDLERALVAAEQHEEAKLEDGVRLVHRALADVLARAGMAEIETNGAFDPHVHEALLAQPVDGAEPGSVVEVLQKGYLLGDRVLRPARVVVAELAGAPTRFSGWRRSWSILPWARSVSRICCVPSVEWSSTQMISFLIGVARTCSMIRSIVSRSLYTGISTDSIALSGSIGVRRRRVVG